MRRKKPEKPVTPHIDAQLAADRVRAARARIDDLEKQLNDARDAANEHLVSWADALVATWSSDERKAISDVLYRQGYGGSA